VSVLASVNETTLTTFGSWQDVRTCQAVARFDARHRP
jgi:hypothetical protein